MRTNIDHAAEKYNLGFRGILLLLILTAGYLVLYIIHPAILRLTVIGTIMCFLLVWNPRPACWISFAPIVFILGGNTIPLGVFYPSFLTLATFGFFGFYIVDRVVWNETLPRLSLPAKLAFMALALQVISIAVSIHIHGQYHWNAIREGSSIFLFIPLILIIPDLCNTKSALLKLTRSIVLALLLAGVVGLIEYMSISDFSRTDLSIGYLYRGRIASLLGNTNIFAGYLELSIPVALAICLWEKSYRWRIIALSATLLGIICVLFTFSRGGLFSTTVGCATVLLFHFRRRPWIPALIVLLFAGILVMNYQIFERQMNFFMNPTEVSNQPTLLHRLISYRGLWQQFSDSPFTGIGWGAKEYFWGQTKIYSFWEIRHSVSTEPIRDFGGLNNLFLTNAVRGGLISLAGLFLVILAAVTASVRAIRKAPFPWGVGFGAGLLGFGIHQIIDNFLCWPQISSFFWLYLGILVTSYLLEQNKDVHENPVFNKGSSS